MRPPPPDVRAHPSDTLVTGATMVTAPLYLAFKVWKSRQSMQRPNEQQQRLSSWAINYILSVCWMLKHLTIMASCKNIAKGKTDSKLISKTRLISKSTSRPTSNHRALLVYSKQVSSTARVTLIKSTEQSMTGRQWSDLNDKNDQVELWILG